MKTITVKYRDVTRRPSPMADLIVGGLIAGCLIIWLGKVL